MYSSLTPGATRLTSANVNELLALARTNDSTSSAFEPRPAVGFESDNP
jgi:hypothetical protein